MLYWQPGLPHVWGGGWSFIATSTCLSALRLALSLLLSSSLTGHCLITPSGINKTHTRGSDVLSFVQFTMPEMQVLVLYCYNSLWASTYNNHIVSLVPFLFLPTQTILSKATVS